MKACVFTLGCKVNKCESDAISTALISLGLSVTDRLEFADFYVVNTCAVTNEAQAKSRQIMSRINALNSSAKTVIMGCASQNDAKSFLDKAGVIAVFGAHQKSKVIEFVKDYLNGVEFEKLNVLEDEKTFDELPKITTFRSRANVKIQDGCNNFCSYCLIPFLRGRCRSRSIESVTREINELDSFEVVLDGINLSAYNDNGKTLTDLIKSLQTVEKRIRLGSLEIGIITDEFLQALKGLKDFAPHFHLSLQSGCDKILKDMNRHYTTDEFYEKCLLIRKYFDDCAITTDIIAGYPTETESDFERTIEFVKKVRFSKIHAFTFSMRSGTKASRLKDLPKQTKKERTARLNAISVELAKEYENQKIGKELFAIGETFENGITEGCSAEYIRIYVNGNYVDKNIKLIATKPYKDGLFCEIIK